MSKDLAASVRARLLNVAKAEQSDFNGVLVRYALEREVLDADILATAIAATFKRRAMPGPTELPVGLSDEFALDTSRQALWRAFLNKNQLGAVPLPELLVLLRARLQPALQQAALVV